MVMVQEYDTSRENAWCPGCGNFPILEVLKSTLATLGLSPHDVLVVSGIGQAGKLPQYMRVNMFNVLHGRTLPVATAAKIANHRLTVLAVGGDGDGYAEGGNHLIHAIRRNVDVTYMVHNNQIYGLTKGQASPTTDAGSTTATTPHGNPFEGLNPIALALGLKTSFVARGFSGNKTQLAKILKMAIEHRGFSFVDILQPCVTFNRVNTYAWYAERVYDVNGIGHNPSDLADAFSLAGEWGERIPTGIFYTSDKTVFHEAVLGPDSIPLVEKVPDPKKVEALFEEFL